MADFMQGVMVDRLGRKPSKKYPAGRICAELTCNVMLSIYNSKKWCWQHTPVTVPYNRAPKRRRRVAA